MAFDRHSGDEVWRALSSVEAGTGVAQPTIIEAGGVRQLIIWYPLAVTALDRNPGD